MFEMLSFIIIFLSGIGTGVGIMMLRDTHRTEQEDAALARYLLRRATEQAEAGNKSVR